MNRVSEQAIINQKLELESRNTKALRDALERSSQLTDNICGILSSFENRLGRLEETILPVYNETANLQKRQDNIEQTLVALDHVVAYYNVSKEVEGSIKEGPATRGLGIYLTELDRVYEAYRYFDDNNPQSVELDNLATLLEVGTEQLHTEFRDKLSQHSKPIQASLLLDCLGLDEESSVEKGPISLSQLIQFSNEAKNDLIKISSWLSNHGKDAHFTVYAKMRSSVIHRSLQALKDYQKSDSLSSCTNSQTSTLSRPKSSTKIDQRSSNSKKLHRRLEEKTFNLISRVKAGFPAAPRGSVAFLEMGGPSEDLLSVSYMANCSALLQLMQAELLLMKDIIPPMHHGRVFEIIIRDSFDSIIKDGENLADRATKSVRDMEFRAAETLCPVLKHMVTIEQEFHSILGGFTIDTLSRLQSLIKLLHHTEDDALNLLTESIRQESDKQLPKDGTVHELTSNVLNFLGRLVPYIDVLATVLEKNATYKACRDRNPRADPSKLLMGVYISRILAALGLNLNTKSEAYGESSLKAIFRINNYTYILNHLHRTGLLEILKIYQSNAERDYNQQIEDQKTQYMQSWSRVVSHLQGNDISPVVLHSNKLKDRDRQLIKDKFTGFNKEIQEIHRIQKGYSIPDAELRETLKRDNKEFLLPKYQQFYDRYSGVDFTKNREKYVRYSPADVSQLIDSLFDIAA